MDKDITARRIRIGQDYGLVLTEEGYQITNLKISYEDLDDFVLECDGDIKNVIAGLAE